MPVLAFTSYFLYSYIVLPLAYTSLTVLYSKRYEICPLIRCIPTLATCLREPTCQTWLKDVAECSEEDSFARERSATTFAHVQHPEDPAYCQYQSFDRIKSAEAIEFLECIGRSGCLKPAAFTDQCRDMSDISDSVLSIEATIPPNVLHGTWNKLYTTGWDIWPCQWTDFWPPEGELPLEDRTMPSPEPWMKHWPNESNVWRMDLYWKNLFNSKGTEEKEEDSTDTSSFTFHMNNEMYFSQTWNFTSSSSSSSPATTTTATLKTRAVMWGTEAHENWYLLDYHPEWQTMLIYYCAYTEAVDRFDSITIKRNKTTRNTRETLQARFLHQL